MSLNTEGLLLGLDIQNNSSQVCIYHADDHNVQTVMFPESGSVYLHPADQKNLYNAREESAKPLEERLMTLISFLIDQARKTAGSQKIRKICITVSSYETEVISAIAGCMKRQLFSRDQWMLISHEEAYAYYAFSQKKELYQAGAMLLDYQPDGLHSYYMKRVKADGIEYILEEKKDFREPELIQAVTEQADLASVSGILVTNIRAAQATRVMSSVYLTGPGFEKKNFPEELTKELVNRKKAFAGQNLYVRGACICACEEVMPQRFQNVVLGCTNRIITGIEVDITERGQKKRFRIVRPGTNWYTASRSMDFILDDIRQITLVMRPCEKRPDYEEIIDISEIPYREGRRTRITMEITFQSEQHCTVTITDKGFGDFVPASGKVIRKEISLSAGDREKEGDQI